MKHLAPACFRAFVCAAGACPDSCCRAGWEIAVDGETLVRYETLPGETGARIRAGVRAGEPPLLRQDENRVCVLLDPDGLCCVQRACGHEALCRVCREYPRYRREFGGLTEHGVSLSCPTAYALAVSAPPVWEEWEDDAPPVLNELDAATWQRLRRGRALALDLLAREDLPLARRLALVRRLAAAMQAAPEKRLRRDYAVRLRRWETAARFDRCGSPQAPGAKRLAARFLTLEILSPAWADALRRFLAQAEDEPPAARGRKRSAHGPLRADCAPETPEVYARWLWYELCKYWIDALDDGDLLGRVDRSLGMLRLGMAMDAALPGEGPFLQRISREIEHCEENLAALLFPENALDFFV